MDGAIETAHGADGTLVPAIQRGGFDALGTLIERLVLDRTVDLDRVERMIEIKQKVDAKAAERSYYAAMSAAQAEMMPVVRNKRNDQTKSNYADIAAVAEAITPIYGRHGFAVSFATKAAPDGCVGIICELMHADGHRKIYEHDIPIDGAGLRGNSNKTATQALGSTLTYGRRYALLLAFNIATKEDRDGNAQQRQEPAKPMIDAAQIAELNALIESTGTDLAKFLEYGQIAALEDLNVDGFAKAKSLLLQKAAVAAKTGGTK